MDATILTDTLMSFNRFPWLRWFIPALLVTAAGFWLLRPAGPSRPSASPLVPVPPRQVHGDITVWSWNIAAKSLMQLVPGFRKKYPGVRVNVDMTGARMQTRLMLSLASGVGAPDVSQLQLTDAPYYIATGRLADLTAVAAKYRASFPAYLWDNCTMNGRVYAIPWDTGPCAVFYKRDVFRKCGVDPDRIETWDDFIAAGKTVVRATGGRTKMLPLGSGGLSGYFLMLIQQENGQIFDRQGRIAVISQASRDALDVIRKLRSAGICSDIQMFSQEYLAGINGPTIATYPGAVWLGGTIKDTAKDFSGHAADWGVFRLPAIRPGGRRVANWGGSVLVIPAQCPNKAAAWAFIEHALCTREGQIAQYRNFDLFPGFLPALSGPGVGAPDPFYGGQPVGRLFARDLTKIATLNITPNWNEGTSYLDQALSHWASSGMSTSGFFEDLEAKMHRRLDLPIAGGGA